jgi:hypothetical protein
MSMILFADGAKFMAVSLWHCSVARGSLPFAVFLVHLC